MLEHISEYPTDANSQRLKQDQPTESNVYGLTKIVAVGYGHKESQRLPISRYSLKISIIGLDTTGVVLGIGFSALGHKVIAVDHDQSKVKALNKGCVSLVDPKLTALLTQVSRLNNLVASNDFHHAILNTDLTIIFANNSGVQNTPADSGDMSSIVDRISSTLQSKRDFHLIVVCQPTHSADTHNFIGSDIEHSTGKTLGKDFGLCFVPLVISEHQALNDFYSLPNMTITVSDTRSESLVMKLFSGFNNKIKYAKYIKM